jgi:hypothetical protein
MATLVVTLVRSRRADVVALAVAALVVPALLALGLARWNGAVGNRVLVPSTPAEVERSYRQAIGNLELDLGALCLPAGTTSIHVRLGIGRMLVTVPSDVRVLAAAHTGVGQLDVLGRSQSGGGLRERVVDPPRAVGPTLALELDAHAGQVEVRRAAPPLAGPCGR